MSPCNITTVQDANTVAIVRAKSGCQMYVLGFVLSDADGQAFKDECQQWADQLAECHRSLISD